MENIINIINTMGIYVLQIINNHANDYRVNGLLFWTREEFNYLRRLGYRRMRRKANIYQFLSGRIRYKMI